MPKYDEEEPVEIGEGDYVLVGKSCWITVNNLSVYIRNTGEGVAVDIYPLGDEMTESIAGTWATFNEGPMEFKIIDTEIVDNSVDAQEQIGEDEYIIYRQPSEISVLVEIEIQGKRYHLDFQTTGTNDYGAYSSSLAPYDGTDSYSDLMGLFPEDEDDFLTLLENIKKESEAENLWEDYVDENYDRDNGYFGGMDANSEINRMTKKG